MLTTKRKPATVGEILVEEFMQPMGLTQAALAAAMGVQRKHVNELYNNRRTVTAAAALILARVFGNSPDFWLNVQRRSDLWEAMNSPRERKRIERATPLGNRRVSRKSLGAVITSDDSTVRGRRKFAVLVRNRVGGGDVSLKCLASVGGSPSSPIATMMRSHLSAPSSSPLRRISSTISRAFVVAFSPCCAIQRGGCRGRRRS
jgi:addiction module HigA family antidote